MKKVEPTGTNQVKIGKGLKKIGFGIFLMFIGPIVFNSSLKNSKHFLYYPILFVGVAICVLAVALFYLGLKTLVRGIFDD